MEDSEEGSSGVPTKTWGFRRTTIARREFLEEVGELGEDGKPVPTRHATRQSRGRGAAAAAAAGASPRQPAPQRTPTTTRRGRGRGRGRGRKSSPGTLLSPSVGAETTPAVDLQPTEEPQEDAGTHPFSDSTEDSDEMTLKQYAEKLKRKQQEQANGSGASTAEPDTNLNTNNVMIEILDTETSTEDEEVAVRKTGKPRPFRAFRFPETEDEESAASEDTDPDAVYCLCRQKHNKRFMICCDRCQEWFHGDCVGISEQRGSLMEKNKEEYVCPNCSPCASPVPLMSWQASRPSLQMRLVSPSPDAGCSSGDYGIKGKIKKSSSEGQKIQIFHSVARNVVVKQEQTLPNCIGPGCTKSALPDSVYCGHDCILKHAAVAMKSMSGPKGPKLQPPPEAKRPTTPQPEPPPEPKPAPEPTPAPKPAPKLLAKPTILSALKAQMKPLLGKVNRKKPPAPPVEVEESSTASSDAHKKEEAPALPSPQTEAVRAQQTTAIAPSVFYKSNKETTQTVVVSETKTDDPGKSEPPVEVTTVPQQQPAPSPETRTIQTDFNLLPLKAPVQPASQATSTAPILSVSDAPVTSGIEFPLLPKPSEKRPQPQEQIPASPSLPSPPASAVSASVLSPVPPQPSVPSPKPKPSIQIRMNVRRSLTDTLWKRVNDSDYISLSEKEVGNIALNIEKAIYNMFLSTDNRYKNKYRLILFNLKDPVNKFLFDQVMSGEISASKLTTLSQEELQGKPPPSPSSPPNIIESTQVISEVVDIKQDIKEPSPNISETTRSIPEVVNVKQERKAEPAPRKAADKMAASSGVKVSKSEVSPASSGPTSIPEVVRVKQEVKVEPPPRRAAEKMAAPSGVQVSKAESSPAPPVPTQNTRTKQNLPNKPNQQLPRVQPARSSIAVDIISNMLKDTTSEHKAHLFDLKCRICTGQISSEDYDNEPELKRMKKSESESKQETVQQTKTETLLMRRPVQETSQMTRPPQVKQETSHKYRPPAQTVQDTSHKERPSVTKQEMSHKESPLQTKHELSDKERPSQTTRETSQKETPLQTKQNTSQKETTPQINPEASQRQRPPPKSILKDRPSKTGRVAEKRAAPTTPRVEAPVMESPASPVPEDTQDEEEKVSDFTPIVIPEVSIVSITRQDPRTAGYRPILPPSVRQPVTPSPPTTPITSEPKVVKPPQLKQLPLPPPPPKSILKTSNPSSSSVRLYSSSRTTSSMASSQPAPDKDTRHFLLKQETIWKGFLDMPTVAKFVTKGYLISGTSNYLREDIPDTIHIVGRILPQTVWDYIEKVKTSPTKDLCLIRFHPATDEEEVAYVSLFSYFNSRRRFGVISDRCKFIKDFYLMPLGAKESIPSLLQPLDGPGFERNRPNLLIGLAILQKPKPPEPKAEQANETRFKTQTTSEAPGGGFSTHPPMHANPSDWLPYDPEMPICATPPGSPDSSSSGSVSSPADLANTVLSIIKAPPPPSSSNTVSDPKANPDDTPLKTILNTLFGKKGVPSGNTIDIDQQSSSTEKKSSVPGPPANSAVDVIVQKYGNMSKVDQVEESVISKDNDDRPYDPEEEYNPEVEYGMLNKPSTTPVISEPEDHDDRPYDPEEYDPAVGYIRDSPLSPDPTPDNKPVVEEQRIEKEVAYDPEDSTFFEEMQADLVGVSGGASGTVVLTDQQKMLLELNKQIEEQKRQLEQQEEALSRQREAAGISMAHFSVSDALLSPPRTSYLSQCDLLQLVEKQSTDANAASNDDILSINQSRDPRQRRDTSQQDTEHDSKNTPSETATSELAMAESANLELAKSELSEKSQTIAEKETSEEGSLAHDEDEKTSNEQINTKKVSPEKTREKVKDGRSRGRERRKSDTHRRSRSSKSDTDRPSSRDRSADASRHSRHRSRHEHRRTSHRDTRDVSSRKRRSEDDRHEGRHMQPHSDNEKRPHRERFEHSHQRTLLGKHGRRRHHRLQSLRESRARLESARDPFSRRREREKSASDDQLKDQGQSTKPIGSSPGQFCDHDSPTRLETPLDSNQYDSPDTLMHQQGPRGSFEPYPGEPFQSTTPRESPQQSGPYRPHHRPLDDSRHPRMHRACSLDSQNIPENKKPRGSSPGDGRNSDRHDSPHERRRQAGPRGLLEQRPGQPFENTAPRQSPSRSQSPQGPHPNQFDRSHHPRMPRAGSHDSQNNPEDKKPRDSILGEYRDHAGPPRLETPLNSKQKNAPDTPIPQTGLRGPFEQHPREPFQNTGPRRSLQTGPHGSQDRPFDGGGHPRLRRAGSHDSQNHLEDTKPRDSLLGEFRDHAGAPAALQQNVPDTPMHQALLKGPIEQHPRQPFENTGPRRSPSRSGPHGPHQNQFDGSRHLRMPRAGSHDSQNNPEDTKRRDSLLREFHDHDGPPCETPLQSNQRDSPHEPMHEKGRRGPFQQHPGNPFEHTDPRRSPPRFGPQGPHHRPFDGDCHPRMRRAGSHDSQNNPENRNPRGPPQGEFHDYDCDRPPHFETPFHLNQHDSPHEPMGQPGPRGPFLQHPGRQAFENTGSRRSPSRFGPQGPHHRPFDSDHHRMHTDGSHVSHNNPENTNPRGRPQGEFHGHDNDRPPHFEPPFHSNQDESSHQPMRRPGPRGPFEQHPGDCHPGLRRDGSHDSQSNPENSNPRGRPQGEFHGHDNDCPPHFEPPFHSNQDESPHQPIRRPGPRGPFEQHPGDCHPGLRRDGPHDSQNHPENTNPRGRPQGPGPRGPFEQHPGESFENIGPRRSPPRFGSQGPHQKPFDGDCQPRMLRAGSHDSPSNPENAKPRGPPQGTFNDCDFPPQFEPPFHSNQQDSPHEPMRQRGRGGPFGPQGPRHRPFDGGCHPRMRRAGSHDSQNISENTIPRGPPQEDFHNNDCPPHFETPFHSNQHQPMHQQGPRGPFEQHPGEPFEKTGRTGSPPRSGPRGRGGPFGPQGPRHRPFDGGCHPRMRRGGSHDSQNNFENDNPRGPPSGECRDFDCPPHFETTFNSNQHAPMHRPGLRGPFEQHPGEPFENTGRTGSPPRSGPRGRGGPFAPQGPRHRPFDGGCHPRMHRGGSHDSQNNPENTNSRAPPPADLCDQNHRPGPKGPFEQHHGETFENTGCTGSPPRSGPRGRGGPFGPQGPRHRPFDGDCHPRMLRAGSHDSQNNNENINRGGPPPREFRDHDCPPRFETPFHSNQQESPRGPIHQPGPRGAFEQHPREQTFENAGPRRSPPRSGPQGPHHKLFDGSTRPGMFGPGSHDSENNYGEPAPLHAHRGNRGGFSSRGSHTGHSEVQDRDFERGMQRPHFHHSNRFDEPRGGSPAEDRRGPDICRPGPKEGFRGRQMVENRRGSIPDAPDMPMNTRAPLHPFPTSASPQHQQAAKDQSPSRVDQHNKESHAPGAVADRKDNLPKTVSPQRKDSLIEQSPQRSKGGHGPGQLAEHKDDVQTSVSHQHGQAIKEHNSPLVGLPNKGGHGPGQVAECKDDLPTSVSTQRQQQPSKQLSPPSSSGGNAPGQSAESKDQTSVSVNKRDTVPDSPRTPRRHTAGLLPTPPGGPFGFKPLLPQPHPNQLQPRPLQNSPGQRRGSVEKANFGPGRVRMNEGQLEEGCPPNQRKNEEPLPLLPQEFPREQGEEGRMSDGGFPRGRGRPCPREQGWKRGHSRGRGGGQSSGGDSGQSEGETRGPQHGRDPGFDPRDAKRPRMGNGDPDGDVQCSGPEGSNRGFRGRSRGRRPMGGGFRGFGRGRRGR